MRWSCFAALSLALLATSLGWFATAQPTPNPKPAVTAADDEALRKANLAPGDGPALVAYLKKRTISDAEQGKVKELIKQFSADNFDERLAASRELEKFGPAAIAPLKAAEKDTDPEVAYRASITLKRLEQIPHTAVAAAAIRRVIQLKPPGTAEALIGFLPLADGEAQANLIRDALRELAVSGGMAEPSLVAALTDSSAVRRGAAYVALIEGGPAAERIRIPDAFPLVRDAVRKEQDPDARFRGLWTLLLTTREKEFIPDLIALTPDVPHNRLRQIEELLLHVAGEHPADGRFGKTPAEKGKAAEAWTTWWKAKGGSVDLVKFPFKPKLLGITEIIELDSRLGQGRVICLGPDMSELWQISRGSYIADARLLPNGKVLLVDMTYSQVGEWDLKAGNWGNPRPMQSQPITAAPLRSGGILTVCRGSVSETDAKGEKVFEHFRQNGDILSATRMPNGETIVVVIQQQPNAPNCIRLDAEGQEIGKGIVLGPMQDVHVMDAVGDHILVCERKNVAEYDLKTGKLVWKHDCDRPTSVQRLPNGNTLIACLNANRGFEVDPDGNVVWEFTSQDQLRVSRIYHR